MSGPVTPQRAGRPGRCRPGQRRAGYCAAVYLS